MVNLVAVALLLPLFAGPPASPGGVLPGAPPADGSPVVELTAQNWGRPMSLLDGAHPVYAHYAARSTLTTVTATIHFSIPPTSFVATLADDDPWQGVQPAPCVSGAGTVPATVTCQFGVGVDRGRGGVSTLTLTVAVPGAAPLVVTGAILGGAFQFTGGYEAMDAAGVWQRIPDDGALPLPATQLSGLRYVVRNIGGVPFRADGACRDATVRPGSTLACPVAGARPVGSWAGTFRRTVDLEDPLGSIGQAVLSGGVTATGATFRLPAGGISAGEPAVLTAAGIADPAALQFRIGDGVAPVLPGSTASAVRIGVPAGVHGATSLDVLQSGITIARMPVTIGRAPAAPSPLPAIVLIVLGALAIVLLALRWSSSRRRRTGGVDTRPDGALLDPR